MVSNQTDTNGQLDHNGHPPVKTLETAYIKQVKQKQIDNPDKQKQSSRPERGNSCNYLKNYIITLFFVSTFS